MSLLSQILSRDLECSIAPLLLNKLYEGSDLVIRSKHLSVVD